MDSRLFKLAVRQIDELNDTVRVVVIHPNFKTQHLLLHHLVEKFNAQYVRFSGKKIALEQAYEQLRQYLPDYDTLAGTLIIDESDRVAPRVLQRLIETLIKENKFNRIFLLTREIPPFAMSNETFGEQAIILPDDPSVMIWDYTQLNCERPQLEIHSFGNGRVVFNGKLIKNWDGTLPRELFFYLVDRGMATRDDIFATFWPTLSVTDATNVFHVTKRKINGVLDIDFTRYTSGYYQVSPDISIHYDVMRFSEYLQMADISDDLDEAEEYLNRAQYLYQGAFLASTVNTWALRRRQELRDNYADLLCGLAEIKRKRGLLDDSLGLLTQALSMNKQDNDIAKSIMQLYDAMNKPADGLAVYDRFHYELHTQFNQEPAFEVQELAEVMRSKLS